MLELRVLVSDLQLWPRRHLQSFKWISSVVVEIQLARKNLTRIFLSPKRAIIQSKSMLELWVLVCDLQLWSRRQVQSFEWIPSVVVEIQLARKTLTRIFLSRKRAIIHSKSLLELWVFVSDLQLWPRKQMQSFRWIHSVVVELQLACKTLTRIFYVEKGQ